MNRRDATLSVNEASHQASLIWQALHTVHPEIARSGLSDDSRRFQKGQIFAALRGDRCDARQLILSVLPWQPSAVLIDDTADWQASPTWLEEIKEVVWMRVAHLPSLLGFIAHRANGAPSEHFPVLAVTGTNGKTSIVGALSSLLTRLGKPCGTIGTLGIHFSSHSEDTGMTTPSSARVHEALADMREDSMQACAMEATSIALSQGRLRGCRFYSAIFTNLTRDHLDYHGNEASYLAAKRGLLTDYPLTHALLHINDSALYSLTQDLTLLYQTRSDAPKLWPVVFEDMANAPTINTETTGINSDDVWRVQGESPQHFSVCPPKSFLSSADNAHQHWGNQAYSFHASWVGTHNTINLSLVVINTALLGYSPQAIANALSDLPMTRGRLEKINPDGAMATADLPEVWVDYAHTPDALEKALLALSPRAKARGGQLWCVFGCGGNRDAGKRPLMGEVALKHAHRIIATSDNPRDEEPMAIIRAIYPHPPAGVDIEANRDLAIHHAIATADIKDLVLIAGKGHETTQEIKGVKHPFVDQDIALKALEIRHHRQREAMRESA